MQSRKKYFLGLLILLASLFLLIYLTLPDKNLHLIACDVGQGDAILAIFGNFEILTDGGLPNGKVLDCLSKYMPFWDREIEVVVNTHPQLDHYGGLIEVFKRYKVDYFVANALDSDVANYRALKTEVQNKNIKVINPTADTKIRYGKISLNIFWPTREFLLKEGYDGIDGKLGAFTSKRDPNNFSVQAILSLGNFDALLTGDIGYNLAEEVLQNFVVSVSKNLDYIKVPHHGSKFGLTPDYLDIINPQFAVISVGAKNRYGHPSPEIINLLSDKGIKILRTDQMGDIEVISNGEKWWVKE